MHDVKTVAQTVATIKTAKRVAALRTRRSEDGLVRVEVWCRPEHVAQIKALAEKLSPL
jgi:hypothetical protein